MSSLLRIRFLFLLGGVVFSLKTEGTPFVGTERGARTVNGEYFHFHHEKILGTSFDLVVRSGKADMAARAELAALAEIERLRRILSAYDPFSEVSRLNVSHSPFLCSSELFDVLNAYDFWNARTGGAYNAQVASLIGVWREAEKSGVIPDPAGLAKIVQSISTAGWELNRCDRTVTRITKEPLNLDSLGKGYIIDRTVATMRALAPDIQSFLVNIGGDIFASGEAGRADPWRIGIADPKNHADNARPITTVLLKDRAVSTSGSYERGFTVAGRRLSHILDARSGLPADGVASATVVAPDNATANALATSLCVLDPLDGLELVRRTPGAECLIVKSDGELVRSAQFASIEIPAAGDAKKANEAKPALWPKNYQVTLTFTLKAADGGRGYKRPYVAVWVEDDKRKRLRTVTVWGNKERYFPDLHDWYYGEKDRPEWALSISRATRPAGRHRVVWDGRDDSGNPLPRGTYTVFIEANREHGTYAKESGKIVCGAEPSSGLIKGASEFDEGQLAYGPAAGE